MESELARQSEILFGGPKGAARRRRARPDQTGDAEGPARQMTAGHGRRLWRHIKSIDGFWESLDETEPGVVARLAALASECRWEVIFLTTRPETAGATAQVQSQRWLQAHGFAHPTVYVTGGSRGRIAASLDLDLVVDACSENCLDIVGASRARAMLLRRDDATAS